MRSAESRPQTRRDRDFEGHRRDGWVADAMGDLQPRRERFSPCVPSPGRVRRGTPHDRLRHPDREQDVEGPHSVQVFRRLDQVRPRDPVSLVGIAVQAGWIHAKVRTNGTRGRRWHLLGLRGRHRRRLQSRHPDQGSRAPSALQDTPKVRDDRERGPSSRRSVALPNQLRIRFVLGHAVPHSKGALHLALVGLIGAQALIATMTM